MCQASQEVHRVSGQATISEAPMPPAPACADHGPPYTPRPRAQQRWVHSCCSIAKLQTALANPDITAIEADIMVGTAEQDEALRRKSDRVGPLPVMAHPSPFSSRVPDTDLSFSDFLDRCLADGTRHLKLDFKQLAAVEPCLELLAERWPQLHSNGQAVWLNADVLPGPNVRCKPNVPAHDFVPLCRRLCPHAVLSLGWTVGPIGPEQVYSQQDIKEMVRLNREYELPGSSVVFAASVRFAERNVEQLVYLLEQLPDAQVLFWTGHGELPIPPAVQTRIHLQMSLKGVGDRVGYDVQLANSSVEYAGHHMVDCTFFFSRWMRFYCNCCVDSVRHDLSSPLPGQMTSGERQPLVGDMSPSPSHPTPLLKAPSAQRMPSGDD
mmetsp:Transcript_13725/g.35311  ORF Transcript_13725/g.35311 Transcript_13725/m.35311 type:complete len:380 (-) Transcript_13725:486-1625(-)